MNRKYYNTWVPIIDRAKTATGAHVKRADQLGETPFRSRPNPIVSTGYTQFSGPGFRYARLASLLRAEVLRRERIAHGRG